MEYEIAIPSYKRSKTIFSDTLRTLLESSVVLSKNVTVFISDKEELEAYKKQELWLTWSLRQRASPKCIPITANTTSGSPTECQN